MRGYGASACPPGVESYRVDAVGADLVGLLDHEGVERAHFVGHDWGAASTWPLGLTHPDRVLSLTGLSVPYAPPSPAPPTEIFRRRIGEDFYMLRFQSEEAPARLERDVERTLLRLFDGRLELPTDGAPMRAPRLAARRRPGRVRRGVRQNRFRHRAVLLPQPRRQLGGRAGAARQARSRRPRCSSPGPPTRSRPSCRATAPRTPFREPGGAPHRGRRPLGAPRGARAGQRAAGRPPRAAST